ncbi:MAG: sulfotransferase family protein [Candidatus Nanopelagicus sp.]|jgi:hypothetical protein
MAKLVTKFNPIPIFIGGTGRSGTTIVGDLLNEHPEIRTSLPTEIKFLANPGGLLDFTFSRHKNIDEPQNKVSILNYRTYRKRKRKDREQFSEFLDLVWSKWWEIDAPPPHGRGLTSGITKLKLERLLNRLRKNYRRDRVKAANQFMLGLISNQDTAGEEKYWVETTPLNIANATRIIRVIPNAKFINMMRDPRDVISSLLTKNWGPNTALEGIEWIEKRLTNGHKCLSAIPDSQQITIKLEDLVIDKREETYLQLLEFLGIEDSPKMKNFFNSKMTVAAVSSGRWKNEVADPIFDQKYSEMIERLKTIGIATYGN